MLEKPDPTHPKTPKGSLGFGAGFLGVLMLLGAGSLLRRKR